MQMDYLDSRNVIYEQILVDEHPEEAQKMIAISGQMGVPFTVVDQVNGERKTILGFDKTRIDEALGLSSE